METIGRVRVKVCGVIDPENARMAAESGADFLGLNFYPRSPRYVDAGRAREIADAVRQLSGQHRDLSLVGVFVNSPAAEIEKISDRVGLDLVQLSGDETPAEVAPFAGRAIRVFRTGGDPGSDTLEAYGDVWGVLFDAPHSSLYGGTGESWGYESVAAVADRRRVFLAGGLGPDNAARAVAACRPYAIDVCSRVESAPGIKDPELLLRLFEEVRHGEDKTPS
ncbi:MAG TPA: phosphoribosylanthranilate isomerase [Thermoanaerobaculia bacterium]|nr:phosphoribosylanthranilate isomerase [Thermoanaerobaculia bacterium]